MANNTMMNLFSMSLKADVNQRFNPTEVQCILPGSIVNQLNFVLRSPLFCTAQCVY